MIVPLVWVALFASPGCSATGTGGADPGPELQLDPGSDMVAETAADAMIPMDALPDADVSMSSPHFVVLGWNDLGMHCYSPSFANVVVLPPFNNLWAQVVQVGDPPRIVSSGVTVKYHFPDNTTSVGKSDFWDNAQVAFGLASPLPPDIGLKGKGLAGTMDPTGDHFIATGIPLTEFSDSAPTTRQPFQLARMEVVQDGDRPEVLAGLTVVAPVSSELSCQNCHADTADATMKYPIIPTGNV